MWGWLPTFRAVAEQQHVSRAAKQLGVSPSAVSRMIGLLEEDVGQLLFTRVGRTIRLNDAGRHLLAGVRSAMRLVDESLAIITGNQFVGALKIASAEPVTRAFLMPALETLRRKHPALSPSVRVAREERVGAMLLSGELDIAFVRLPTPRPQLSLQRMGEVSGGVYCGAGHPLYGAKRCRVSDAIKHPFVTFEAEHATRGGWWPPAYRRNVSMVIEALDVVAEVCAAGELLAALPDVVAARHRDQYGLDLFRLPLNVVKPIEVYALWRQQLELPGRAEALVDLVRDQFR
jgi:DNA-binding transcriptional LysR family regulator